jgi:hypothetical protein
MRRKMAVIGAALLGLMASSGLAAYVGSSSRNGGWHDIAWPFPRDGWPPGKAYRCSAEACGEEMELYVRPKIGFCNCDTGVADDDEVDRVADLDLISPQFRPLQPGQVTWIADMPGRARPYDLGIINGSPRRAVGMAVSRRCDLMVAVVQGKATAADLQQRALEFLASREAAGWITSAMQGG